MHEIITSLGDSLHALSRACPSVIDGLLWVAKHYDVLPSVGRPVASVLCPALGVSVAAGRGFGSVGERLRSRISEPPIACLCPRYCLQSIVRAAPPDFFSDATSICGLLGGGRECVRDVSSWLSVYGSAESAATQLCYAHLPALLDPER